MHAHDAAFGCDDHFPFLLVRDGVAIELAQVVLGGGVDRVKIARQR